MNNKTIMNLKNYMHINWEGVNCLFQWFCFPILDFLGYLYKEFSLCYLLTYNIIIMHS